MKQFRLITAFLAVSLVFAFSSCEKEGPAGPGGPQGEQGVDGPKGDKGDAGDTGPRGTTGATGPRGATGATGATGPRGATGATGPQGPKGDPGTANVMYFPWFMPTWDQEDTPETKLLRITEVELNEATGFLNQGAVLVYYRYMPSSGSRYDYLLPQNFYKADGSLDRRYEAYVYGNGIYIRVRSYNGPLTAAEAGAAYNRFRYVLIPGGVDISALERRGVDLNNYEEVVAALKELR